ncbi:MAG: DUF1624 domain-containing protein [Corynebacterium sp.]|nr:DUF1624 domain-containing protein [Corynebacterium sp.]
MDTSPETGGARARPDTWPSRPASLVPASGTGALPDAPGVPKEAAADSVRPLPGPARVRTIWDGEHELDPTSLAHPPPLGESHGSVQRWSRRAAFGPVDDPRRITGLDAARGFALLGMVAVHTMPAYNELTGEPTMVWRLFAGHSSALFGVLAGVTIALITGANNPHTGLRLRRDRVSLAVRALIILAIGLLLDQVGVPVYNILPYYALMFLVAIALTGLRIRHLLAFALLFTALGPVVIRLVAAWGGYTTTLNPSFTDVADSPLDMLITLTVGGTYPAVTWMAYICVGMTLGRLDLRSVVTHIWLVVVGGGTAAFGILLSTFLLDYGRVFRNIYELTDGYDATDIQEVLDYGPDGHLPTDTWWWLATSGPHTNTTLSVVSAAGLAVLAIGVFLLIASGVRELLTPLIAVGSMTLTIYVSHLLFLKFALDADCDNRVTLLIVQIVGAVLFAVVWTLVRGRGPLEEIVSRICRFATRGVGRTPNPTPTPTPSS